MNSHVQHENETDHLGGEVIGDHGEEKKKNGSVGFGAVFGQFGPRVL